MDCRCERIILLLVNTLAQQRELIIKWIEALRSGEYKQGKNNLYCDNAYCCLGVAGKLVNINLSEDEYNYFSIQKVYGLFNHSGQYGIKKEWDWYQQPALSSDNDNGVSFNEIADLIESNPPGLFVPELEAYLKDNPLCVN